MKATETGMKGCIHKRGQSWAFTVEVGRHPQTGRRRQKTKSGFRTRREAQHAMVELLREFHRGTYVEPTKQTVTEFLRAWLEAARGRGLRETTLVGYEVMIEKHLIPELGALPLHQLTAAHLNAFYAELGRSGHRQRSGGLSARTVRAAHTIMRRALKDAVRWGMLARNVAEVADPPSAAAARADARKAMKTWTTAQLREFLEHAREHSLYTAFLLAAMTGMRRGEVLGLRWRDLDFDAGRLSITQTLVAPRHQLVFSEPKTAASRRMVALDDITIGALRDHHRRQAAERLAAGSDYNDLGLVFAQEEGSPLNPMTFTQRFQKASRDAGLPQIRLHDLRHGHVTYLMEAGVPLPVIAQRVGHSSVAVTGDTYSHVRPELRDDIARLGATLIFQQAAPELRGQPDNLEPLHDLAQPNAL